MPAFEEGGGSCVCGREVAGVLLCEWSVSLWSTLSKLVFHTSTCKREGAEVRGGVNYAAKI